MTGEPLAGVIPIKICGPVVFPDKRKGNTQGLMVRGS